MVEVKRILQRAERQIERKAKLYDGVDSVNRDDPDKSISKFMFSITEEHGEVASALIRDRYHSALDECIDVICSTILLHIAIEKKKLEDEK